MPKEIDAIIESISQVVDVSDVLLPFESVLLLIKDQTSLGFYVSLRFMMQMGMVNYVSQKHLAKLLGLSQVTFISRRNELVRIGLLEVMINGNRRAYKLFQPRRVKNLYPFTKPSEVGKSLDETRKMMYDGEMTSANLRVLSNNIYVPNPSFPSNNNIPNKESNTVTNTLDTSISRVEGKLLKQVVDTKGSASTSHFNQHDLNRILKAYFKYSGTERKGPELIQVKGAIQAMYKAGRTADEIIRFMKWIDENKANKDYSWLRFWTMWTVQKRLPDFLSGALTKEEEQNDGFRQL